MNESLTIASAHVSREQALSLVIDGLNSIRDGILAYHELELTLDDLYADLKAAGWSKSKRTLQRAQTDLRQEGLLPAGTCGKAATAYKIAKSGNPPVENSSSRSSEHAPTHPEPSTNDQPTRSPVCPPFLSVVPELEPECETGTEQFHSVPMGADDCRVVAAEVVTMPDGERDFQRAMQLFAELDALSARNFKDGWTELQWNTLGGECRTLAECCDARGKRQRSRPQRQVFALSAN